METEDSHSYNATHPCWLFCSHCEYCQTAEACLLWGTQTDNFEQRSVKLKYWNKTRRKLLWTVLFCTTYSEWMKERTNICKQQILFLTKAQTGANDEKRQCLRTTTGRGRPGLGRQKTRLRDFPALSVQHCNVRCSGQLLPQPGDSWYYLTHSKQYLLLY